ncbi:molybdate ABC transporter permease subunit [Shewanella sp. SR43-4]|jgi:molybdate transport system permease protein|uniref:Molybdenum transport system permease n=1 Tax=Shewanella vesiculosa TaxID=518738 RepID=A0ABV0FTR5_9GAMM|nr:MULTISPECIES: molybdate ABC transporter permease subunit [Shewanella]NCQ46509.1 molybdate ABC transporter permease subunit [Shewanella frigidimarina]MBB1319325.1 molybdate ABC transporter permease subunit [Shewanella sp. SR43-4]MBB1391884.1 molybdate ABC transporter permease subunit [Shewanella sp. SG44-6]NCO72741.1 molybdate ABC transporter permease subunit [Shewanella vesiculosa]NCP38210.1 molybdate ABC transporter permease subunit [Shewanella vesiculosa]|tara:strand:- start:511 stop:1191 length:681 start_codon:yes stop_codon:yes gene_type:complete
MDWQALWLSVRLSCFTVVVLIPLAIVVGRWLAYRQFKGKSLLEALIMAPLVLPPTVIGYYLLVGLGNQSMIGQWVEQLTGQQLVFHFSGLVIASIIVNIPFAVQPIQRAFETIPIDIRDAAACCGMSRLRIFFRVELPMIWPGVLTALVLCFSHVLGEFGVVLMLGGNIAGETKTISIAIYDSVQAFDFDSAGMMSLVLLLFAVSALALTTSMSRRLGGHYNASPR